jgi:hypothetical protein
MEASLSQFIERRHGEARRAAKNEIERGRHWIFGNRVIVKVKRAR